MGLILWYGSTNPAGGDFLSLGIINGYLQLIYNAGNGEVSILYNLTRVDDGHWHRVNIFRFVNAVFFLDSLILSITFS